MKAVRKAWLFIVLTVAGGTLPALQGNPGYQPSVPPFQPSAPYEQVAAAVSVLAIKPLYMLLSLLLIVVLWRLKSPGMIALRRGLIAFLVGETFCGVNIVLFRDTFQPFEFLHMYGMVVAFAFFIYAVLVITERKIAGHPGRNCGLLGLCGECAGTGDCRVTRLFYFLVPAGIILAFIPLLASTREVSYYTNILGFSFNYAHPVVYQLFEIRYAPVYAIVLLAASFLVLLLKRTPNAPFRILFAAGSGCLGFSLLRLFFFSAGGDNLIWPNFWEEATELLFMAGIAFALWTFRSGLFTRREKATGAGAAE